MAAALDASLGAALGTAVANVLWVQLPLVGVEPTRRPMSLLALGTVTYAVGGLILAAALGAWRRLRGGAGFGRMLSAVLACWTFLFLLEGLAVAMESRSAAFMGLAAAALCASMGAGWALSRWLPDAAPPGWRWVVYPLVAGVVAWPLLVSPVVGESRPTESPGGSRRPNVVLLVLDTLRADHLSIHGAADGATPTLDTLGREGVRFEAAWSASSWTLPGVASIMTGHLPSVHGAGAERLSLDRRIPTLAQILRSHGYRTGGFVAGPWCKGEFGFDAGFDLYDDELEPTTGKIVLARVVNRGARFLAGRQLLLGAAGRAGLHYKRRAEAVNREVFAWLDRLGSRPFFLFINYFDPHSPYDPPPGYRPSTRGQVDGNVDWWKHRHAAGEITLTDEDRRHLLALYAGEIRYLDREVGRLIGKLRELGVLDDTIVVVTSDHGEAFLEHGQLTHGETLYQEEVRVPLIVRFPRAVPTDLAVRTPVQSFDLFPTVLALLGIPAPSGIHAVSLVDRWAVEKSAPRRPVISQVFRDRAWENPPPGPDIMALRDGSWKYILEATGRQELYRLDAESGEVRNLAEAQPDEVARLAALLRTVIGEPLWPAARQSRSP